MSSLEAMTSVCGVITDVIHQRDDIRKTALIPKHQVVIDFVNNDWSGSVDALGNQFLGKLV